MKRPFLGCVLFALPLLAFVACGDESAVNVNNVKQIAADDEGQDDEGSKDSDTPVSSGKQSSKSSSSTKSSEKSSSSAKAETSESDIVASEKDLPRCSLKREGMEVYVKDEKTLYTCEDGEWTPEKDAPKDSKKSSSSEADATPKSSSSVIYIDVDFSSSSKKDPVIIVDKPTSSATIIDVPWELESSSSEVAIVTNLGSCAPLSNPISKNTAVAWKFTPNHSSNYKPMDFVLATYEWDFGGLTANGSGSTSTSGEVTYAAAGDYTASVVVTMRDGSSEVKQCEPLHVNGDPILGCSCKSDQTTPKVDVADGPVTVNWTVTCQTLVSAWTWTGATGTTATASAVVNDKDIVKPSVTVATDESTLDVECDQVEGYDAAVYGKDLELPYNDLYNPLEAGTYRLNMTYEGWTGYSEDVLIYPTLQITVNSSCTVKLNGVATSITFNAAIKNTDELVILETPANCVIGISAY